VSSQTRDALIDAAEALLDGGGQDAVTLREVGKRVGVSHNAPYKHFSSKEALLAAVAARELDHYRDAILRARREAGSPLEALRTSLHEHVNRSVAHLERFHLIYGRWTTTDAELIRAAHGAYDAMLDLVRAAQASGSLPPTDPERLAALLRATAHGAADLAAAGHLEPEGKGRSDAAGLIDDLLAQLG